ncbi:hypothetical protein Taro_038338 [Colocasia esculenta]|uniref:Uncharacterized protein n=1 Tax=Colocasia esculenta TaxID=4460 RepID=A0A843WDM8_COLES|nr:hypothetical protein [Colocasia esculenta]
MNSCDRESLPEESRGGEPREQGSVGITSSLPARAAGTPTSGSKTTLQSSKVINAYHRVLQSSGTKKSLNHNPGQANDDSRRTNGQHNAEANPQHTPAETKKLMEHRSNRVRPKSHNISTNIPDLHEVGKEQPGVTLRDTKQPSENERLTTGTATSDLHKVEGPQAEPPYTSDTPRGQGTTHSGTTIDGTKERVTETAVGCLHQAPRENPQSGKPLSTAHKAKLTKPKEARHG